MKRKKVNYILRQISNVERKMIKVTCIQNMFVLQKKITLHLRTSVYFAAIDNKMG